jgi:uncharacterized protein
MVKLAILGLAAYLGWKAWQALHSESAQRVGRHPERGPVSRLVRDPQCNTYVPEHSAERIHVEGEVLYFCSPECREAYLRQKRGEMA